MRMRNLSKNVILKILPIAIIVLVLINSNICYAWNPVKDVYNAQTKVIKGVQKGVEHAGKELYDEQKKVIKKIQDSLTPEQKQAFEKKIQEFDSTSKKRIAAALADLLIQINTLKEHNEKLKPLIETQSNELEKLKNSNDNYQRLNEQLNEKVNAEKLKFWVALIGVVIALLTIIKLFLNIKDKNLENINRQLENEKLHKEIEILKQPMDQTV